MDHDGCGIVVGWVFVFILAVVGGYYWGRADTRKAAIDSGVAEYFMPDKSTGKSEFRWKWHETSAARSVEGE